MHSVLDRENNDKNSTLPLGKQIFFIIVWGCAEILPIPSLAISLLKMIMDETSYFTVSESHSSVGYFVN